MVISALKVADEQKKNAEIGLKLEKTPNKTKLEISMININNQLKEQNWVSLAQKGFSLAQKGFSLAQKDEMMRMSIGSNGDVTTLGAQTNTFNQTYMSRNRAFNQSIATFKSKITRSKQLSPALSNQKKSANQSQDSKVNETDIGKDFGIGDTEIKTG